MKTFLPLMCVACFSHIVSATEVVPLDEEVVSTSLVTNKVAFGDQTFFIVAITLSFESTTYFKEITGKPLRPIVVWQNSKGEVRFIPAQMRLLENKIVITAMTTWDVQPMDSFSLLLQYRLRKNDLAKAKSCGHRFFFQIPCFLCTM